MNQAWNELSIGLLGESLRIINVVEFPKCGGTWLRKLIASYRGVPDLTNNSGRIGRRGVYKRHSLYSSRISWPVLIVRDPRDVYASYYHHDLKLGTQPAGFVHQPDAPLVVDFGNYLTAKLAAGRGPGFRHSYSAFALSWHDRPYTALVRYEDLLSRPVEQLARVFQGVGEKWDEEAAELAVRRHSLNRVRAGGRGHEHGNARLGIAGDWMRHFSQESLQMLFEREQSAFALFGYPLP